MHRAKVTTPKALQTKQQVSNNGVCESFRYYGSASAGSVPFMWESHPGTPKHALTESSLPPLTPPPSYHQLSQKYNSSMHVITNHHHSGSTRSWFFRTIFHPSSRKKNMTSSLSSCSVSSSSSSSSSSHLRSWQSTPMSKTEVRRVMKFGLEDEFSGENERSGESPTSCLGGGFKKSYRIKRMKKAMLSFVRSGNGKA